MPQFPHLQKETWCCKGRMNEMAHTMCLTHRGCSVQACYCYTSFPPSGPQFPHRENAKLRYTTYKSFSSTDDCWIFLAEYKKTWVWAEMILFPYPNPGWGAHLGTRLQICSLRASRRQDRAKTGYKSSGMHTACQCKPDSSESQSYCLPR